MRSYALSYRNKLNNETLKLTFAIRCLEDAETSWSADALSIHHNMLDHLSSLIEPHLHFL